MDGKIETMHVVLYNSGRPTESTTLEYVRYITTQIPPLGNKIFCTIEQIHCLCGRKVVFYYRVHESRNIFAPFV